MNIRSIDPRLLVGEGILLALAAVALGAGMLFPGDPQSMVAQPLLAPGAQAAHPLGTDMLGRDVAAGLAHGARATLLIGVVSTVFAVVVGGLIGVLSGYFGGWVDNVLGKITELFQTVPPIILVIALTVVLGPSIRSMMIAIAAVSWPPIARLARGEVLALREREFIEACTAVGMTHGRIILRHVLPNIAPPILITISIVVATSILIESGLSFLGLGDSNVTTWGGMIGAGREMIRTEWQLTAIPGTAIMLTVLALNFVAEALSEGRDPRLALG
ncbi:ABC transporter permease [Verticiella sediminum]|uniref:ABC transporter permease n=1 Tax=Verticiella sediminum TaxID=1247510 RepID=A0A556AB75_9BURK|nr:ABC transporter permease [Verticiella sediminum]TSH90144.1 ABC transporter permease [Verticiella sediminum]